MEETLPLRVAIEPHHLSNPSHSEECVIIRAVESSYYINTINLDIHVELKVS